MMLATIILAAAVAAPPSLTGLWAARRNFGPEVRGTLLIQHDARAWRAEIAGRSAEAKVDGSAITFALPNDEGAFRGVMRGDRIVGHWIQSPGASAGGRYATPVTLARHSPARWSGIVKPLDDHMTFYMPVTAAGGAFLRNPERNVGRFLDVRRLAVDGSRVKFLGKDDKVVAEGTYDAENDAISVWLAPGNGTYDFHRATAAEEAAFYPRGKTPPRFVYRKPVQRNDGWPVATLEEAGISRDGMAKFIEKVMSAPVDSLHTSDLHAVLIARHGKLVLEEYFHGANPEEPHDTRSAAKSLTSILVGAAKVDTATRVYDAMSTKTDDRRKQAMTLEHLLMMSSGLDCDDDDDDSPGNEDVMQNQTAQPDWYRYTLDLKNIRNPGEKSVYCSCQPNLAGGVLGRKTGRWLPDLFRDQVAQPMQIERYGMNLTPTGEAYMGGGVRFTPRDFMKLPQMMIDGGRWHGRQIVSAEWAKRSTSPHTKIGDRLYGYLWWIQDYPYKGHTVRAFFAAGNGGQIAMGIPELDLVIAFFGGNYSDALARIPQSVYVPEYILPAVN
jgi:CubicO group peptidase (beta-lactamase class C family)